MFIFVFMNIDLDDVEEIVEEFIVYYKDDYRVYYMYVSVMGVQVLSSIFFVLGYVEKVKYSLEVVIIVVLEEVNVYQVLMQFYLMVFFIVGGDMEEVEKLVDKIVMFDVFEGQFVKVKFYFEDE